MLYINKPYITLLLLAVNATKHRLPRPSLASDRKSTRLNSSHSQISYAVFCLKKKKNIHKNRAVLRQYTSIIPQILLYNQLWSSLLEEYSERRSSTIYLTRYLYCLRRLYALHC